MTFRDNSTSSMKRKWNKIFPLLEEETVIREHIRKKKATHEDLFKGLKVEKVVIPLPEEDQVCPVCGTQMVLIGEEYVRRELEFIPATCKVIEYYSQPAVQGVQYCNRLFAIEDSINKNILVYEKTAASREGKTCSGGFLDVA